MHKAPIFPSQGLSFLADTKNKFPPSPNNFIFRDLERMFQPLERMFQPLERKIHLGQGKFVWGPEGK